MLLCHDMSRTGFNHGAENTNKIAVRFTARHLQLFAFTQNAYSIAHFHPHSRNEKCHHLYTYEVSLWRSYQRESMYDKCYMQGGKYQGTDKSLARPTSLSIVYSVQGTGGSPTGPDPENRAGDQDTGSPGRPVSSGLQVPDKPSSWSGQGLISTHGKSSVQNIGRVHKRYVHNEDIRHFQFFNKGLFHEVCRNASLFSPKKQFTRVIYRTLNISTEDAITKTMNVLLLLCSYRAY
jgi:hypothetical protein